MRFGNKRIRDAPCMQSSLYSDEAAKKLANFPYARPAPLGFRRPAGTKKSDNMRWQCTRQREVAVFQCDEFNTRQLSGFFPSFHEGPESELGPLCQRQDAGYSSYVDYVIGRAAAGKVVRRFRQPLKYRPDGLCSGQPLSEFVADIS